MKSRLKQILCQSRGSLLALPALFACSSVVQADPHVGQSVNVAVTGSRSIINGGTLPAVAGFNFFDTTVAGLSLSSLTDGSICGGVACDTLVLNVASSGFFGGLDCSTAGLTGAQKADINSFAANGGKVIIYDSECTSGGSVDYSWLSFPFNTTNPGAFGFVGGTLNIVEDNILSHTSPASPHHIDTNAIETQTDAVGDMNVVDLATVDPGWCLDMSGTNVLNVTGATHMYAQSGSGLFIYNGLDTDFITGAVGPTGGGQLAKIWLQELEAVADPALLPCLVSPVGITLSPDTAENDFGTDHTVTANLTDLAGVAQPGILVSFEITAGPNVGEVSDPGECSVNADCTTDASGDVSWTYTDAAGVEACDTIVARFTNTAGEVINSDTVEKCWAPPPNTPPVASCTESVNPAGKNVPPAGSTTLPGPKGGQNEDSFYEIIGADAEDETVDVFVTNGSGSVTFGPFAPGSVVKITEAPGAIPSSKPMGGPDSAVVAHIRLDSDASVYAVDSFGEISPVVSCLVPPPPK
jgi:hypothetical protein